MKNKSNILVSCIDSEINPLGYSKRGNSWIYRYDEVAIVVNLQKSPHSRVHFINLGVFIYSLADSAIPKSHLCQIQLRLNCLVDETPGEKRAFLKHLGQLHPETSNLIDTLESGENLNGLLHFSDAAINFILMNRSPLDRALDLDETDISNAKRSTIVQNALRNRGLPYLNQFKSIKGICRSIKKKEMNGAFVWGSVRDLCRNCKGKGK